MNDSVIDIFSLCRFFFKFGGNLTSRWYLHSPPSGKEGWLKAGVVGGYTMLIITDLRIHLPPPPTGTPPSRRRRMEILPTINCQVIILPIHLITKFFLFVSLSLSFVSRQKKEPHGIKIIPTKKYFSGTN